MVVVVLGLFGVTQYRFPCAVTVRLQFMTSSFVPSGPAVDVALGRLERFCQLPLLGSGGSFKGKANAHMGIR